MPAAGRGKRAGPGLPKQFRPIAGVPMLLRTLRPFAAHPDVAAIVVALPKEHTAMPPAFLADVIGERVRLVAGGTTRAESVALAVNALPHSVSVILVHDAARPFVARGTIDDVIAEAREGRGAVPALPVTDALKHWLGAGTPVRSVGRDYLWRAQTPQGFPASRFREICAHAHGRDVADDASLWEEAGESLVLVPDRTTNIKITTPEDLTLAEALAGATP